MEYRGVKIECSKIGTVKPGGAPLPVERCQATVNNKTFMGTVDDIKKKIDEELDRKEL